VCVCVCRQRLTLFVDYKHTGGVSKEWWPVAIARYHWPVDPASVETMDDHVYTLGRYHVSLRKLAKPTEEE
jgi:hypothetical protein